MITFLPVPSFKESAQILDYRRLGKQRVEALMLLRIYDGQPSNWIHHPVVRMWKGHESALQRYTIAMCEEWIGRGYKDTITPEICSYTFDEGSDPDWDPRLFESHQSNLVRKLPEHYRKYFPHVPDDMKYFWPNC